MTDKPPILSVSKHSESIWCPHCGEESGIEDKIESAREIQRDDTYAKTLRLVGEWLANLTISGNAVANELRIVEGIGKLKRGEMPK